MTATLLNDGDSFEKYYWSKFLCAQFISYEKYWASKIVPMTNRPTNIHFKSSSQLVLEGFTSDDICKAQLHYSTLRHLVRAFEINKIISNKKQTILDTDLLAEGLFHIAGEQDVAFEFLQRVKEPNHFDPWSSKKNSSLTRQPASKEAMEKWKKNNGYPLQDIRNYRNHLTHGRMAPSFQMSTYMLLPKIGKENDYLDWRFITDWNSLENPNTISDFDKLDNILSDAWSRTIQYLEFEWQKII